ncbi:MAG: hypothetical protein JKY37_04375, partial [Nannocystaceae bacterium]|nr:hypothetical protein [Nannocystaceae bacterium]
MLGPWIVGGCIVIADDTSASGVMDGPFTGATQTGQLDTTPTPGDSPSADDGPDPDDTAGESDTNDTEDDPACNDNVLTDGGFELGTPNAAWGEASPLFGTPICDDTCSEDPGAAPYAGDWFAWFGGATRPDTASLT